MTKATKDANAPLGLKAWYTLAEYAAATGQTIVAVRHQADRGTLRTGRVPGKKERVVFISYLRAEHPEFWASVATIEALEAMARRGR